MIPLVLKINNFLSYGNQTQTINFTPYKLICLSGKNGHGKSALLDALTWALWGQARKISATSKPDQGLVHLGEVEMMVSLDFIFNNQKFRVKRNFSQKYGKPHTHVEFGMLDANSDRFISLTDKTIRKTEEKIIETIGLDYETFTNTCFLKQGQSNEFSKKSAKERKEILSNILGLNHYDQTRKFILESIKELQQKLAQQEYINQRIDQEIQALDTQLLEQESIDNALTEISKQEEVITKARISLLENKEAIVQKEEQLKLLVNQHETYQDKKKEIKLQLHQEIKKWRKTHALLIACKNRTHQQSEKKQLEEKAANLQKQLHMQLANKEQLLKIKEAIAHEETILSRELQQQSEVIQKNIMGIESSLQVNEKQNKEYITLLNNRNSEYQQLTKQLNELLLRIPSSYLLYEEKEVAKIFERHKSLYRSWIERANRAKQEITETHHKQELSGDQDNPSCPLCEQNLSQARKRFLQKKLHDEQHALTHRFNRLKNSIHILKEYLQEEYLHIQSLEQRKKILDDQELLHKEIIKIKEEQDKLAQHYKTLRQHQEEQHGTLQKLKDLYVQKIKESLELQTLHTQEKEVLLSLSSYESTSQEYNAIQKKIETFATILVDDAARENLIKEQTQRHALITQLKKERFDYIQALKSTEQTLKLLDEVIHQKKSIDDQLQQLHNTFSSLARQKQESLEKKAILLHAQEKKKTLEKEKSVIEEERKKLTVQYLEEQTLAQAFSKDGIQALLIEEALPELEYEANDLLARLTDNQAHISIESLRDLKKGGTRETLDINISDAQGVRPYELFSGGEAFRIDFALRIAISKLLARRAGTSLQTLIIDEGFGSQDDDGLNRIMDAIYTIQEDFEKIIIVSHLSAMKEQFPVHFIVNKNPQGSVVTVVEND